MFSDSDFKEFYYHNTTRLQPLIAFYVYPPTTYIGFSNIDQYSLIEHTS